jgi:hypothetical protein
VNITKNPNASMLVEDLNVSVLVAWLSIGADVRPDYTRPRCAGTERINDGATSMWVQTANLELIRM